MKIKDQITSSFMEALRAMGAAEDTPLVLEQPKQESHGDLATPIALTLAKQLKKNPMEIAEKIAGTVSFPAGLVESIDVAKPGFINLTLSAAVLRSQLFDIIALADRYGSANIGRGRKWQVEYISANPTGPLVIVSARAAAIGSVLVNLLSFCGYDAEGEYYVNDHGRQVQALGGSLRYHLRDRFGMLAAGEEIGAYPGGYLKEIASEIPETAARGWLDGNAQLNEYGAYATEHLLAGIREDLRRFGVHFNSFFFESALHPGEVDKTLGILEREGYVYESDGALFFSSSRLGDEKDRVLRKSDGDATYFLGDIAYHLTKLERGYKGVIDIWGPDHHGHIPRMKAAAQVLGAWQDWLEVMIVGWVRLIEDNKPVSMSKRAGEFITMRELIEDVGSDVAKYFFLMRRPNTPLDFDLDLARKQSEENPVFYVQYAHARISSVIRFAKSKGVEPAPDEAALRLLAAAEERRLMLHLMFFPYVVEGAAGAREPHRMTVYAQELATLFHQFYHQCRIVSEDETLSSARLLLAEATMQVLKNALTLLGVAAPESM